jgi:phage replication initiation protein
LKIDWLEGTILGIGIQPALDQMMTMFPDFQELERGGLGYEYSAVVLQTARVYWSHSRPLNGVHFSLPPSAIELSSLDYLSYARRLNAPGTQFTRVDLAVDDTQGILDLKTICHAVESGHFTAQAKKKPKQFIDYEGIGRTFYFGREQSKTRIRIYDKAAEQCARGKQYVGHWVRAEMQLRAERADVAVQYILGHPADWQKQACGWLLSALDFKIPGTDPNKSRWETASWWLTFLNFASKQRIFISRRVRTIDDVAVWVDQQVGPSLLVLQTVYGAHALSDIANNAATRLKSKHLALIEQGCADQVTAEPEIPLSA